MSLVENNAPEATAALKELYPITGQAFIVGITGPPGSGKSTLTDQLTKEFRRGGKTVGIIAVDPTSPFTGGAILADRIRMQQHSLDAGVFIRSMATRGHLGGLAKATGDVVNVLDAAGGEVGLVEPGGGGGGGGGGFQTRMGLGPGRSDWVPPILKTVATQGQGIAELAEGILAHRAHLDRRGLRERRQRERSRALFLELLQEQGTRRLLERASANGTLEQTIERIATRETDPYSAVEELLAKAGL